jgi:hypothetical protein
MMEGVNAYRLPTKVAKDGITIYPEILDIGGFAYLYYPEIGIIVNLQAVSQKFKDWTEVKAAMGEV